MVSNPHSVRTHSFSDSNQKETHSLDFPTGFDNSALGAIPGGVFHRALNALEESYYELISTKKTPDIKLLKAALTSFQEAEVDEFTPYKLQQR